MPLGKFAMLPREPTLAEIEAAGGQIVQRGEVHEVAGGLFLSSGDIPRTTEYETGLGGHYSWREGQAAPDPEIHDSASSPLRCVAEAQLSSRRAPTPESSTSHSRPSGWFRSGRSTC